MLQKIEVEDVGETDFLKGEQIDRIEFEEKNQAFGKIPASAEPVLLGIAGARSAADPYLHLGGLLPGDEAASCGRCRH